MNMHVKMSIFTTRQSAKTVYFFFLLLPPATGEFCRTDVDSSLTLSKSWAGCQHSGLRRYIGHGGSVIYSNTNTNSNALLSYISPGTAPHPGDSWHWLSFVVIGKQLQLSLRNFQNEVVMVLRSCQSNLSSPINFGFSFYIMLSSC